MVAYFAERDSLVICDTVDTLYIHDTLYLGIGMVDLPNAKIYQHNGEIVVEGAEGNTVTLYDAIGRLLATKRDDATVLRFDVPSPGTYTGTHRGPPCTQNSGGSLIVDITNRKALATAQGLFIL